MEKASLRLMKLSQQLQQNPDLGLPALHISKAFPQVTSATAFPPVDDLLSNEEKELRQRVRVLMESEIAPIITPYWEKALFPFEVIPKLASLKIAGGTIKDYGCPGLSLLGSAIAYSEIARVDVSCSTFILVHSTLAMLTIEMFGTEQQKNSYLPPLAKLDAISCWALTEPNFGSDASSLDTTATKVDGGWLLNGQKRWIGNSTFANLAVIIARNTETDQINGFIVKEGAPGYHASKIENKISVRIIQNGDIVLENVFVPEVDRIPGVKSFQEISKVLVLSRVMVAWQAVGISMGIYDMCYRYLQERKQFGAPLAALQINQEKMVSMLGSIQAMAMFAWKLCKLHDEGKMTSGHASLAKAWNTKRARKVAALGRELLGGNGIVTDFHVAKAFSDLEPLYTYEGSYEINTLITGREVTGLASIKPRRL